MPRAGSRSRKRQTTLNFTQGASSSPSAPLARSRKRQSTLSFTQGTSSSPSAPLARSPPLNPRGHLHRAARGTLDGFLASAMDNPAGLDGTADQVQSKCNSWRVVGVIFADSHPEMAVGADNETPTSSHPDSSGMTRSFDVIGRCLLANRCCLPQGFLKKFQRLPRKTQRFPKMKLCVSWTTRAMTPICTRPIATATMSLELEVKSSRETRRSCRRPPCSEESDCDSQSWMPETLMRNPAKLPLRIPTILTTPSPACL